MSVRRFKLATLDSITAIQDDLVAAVAADRAAIENHLIAYVTEDDVSLTVKVANTMVVNGTGTLPYEHVVLELAT